MIRCEICKKVSESKEQTHEIITKKREKEYRTVILQGKLPDTTRQQTLRLNNEDEIEKYISWGFKVVKQFKTTGWEIEESKRICNECYIKAKENE